MLNLIAELSHSRIVKMNVFALLICCFVHTGASEKPAPKRPRLSKACRVILSAMRSAKTYMSRQQSNVRAGTSGQCLFDEDNDDNISRLRKLLNMLEADWNEEYCSSQSDSLMTVSLTSTLRPEDSERLSYFDVAACQESKYDLEQLRKYLLCWKKGGTVPVHLRASIMEECFGMVLLGR